MTNLRKQIATDLGLILPAVHLRDNLRLEANAYRISLRGGIVGKGAAYPDRLMALDPVGGNPRIEGVDGIEGREPAFNLPALWVSAHDRARAESAGLTLVDAASVLTTHLSEVIRKNAHELAGRQQVQELLSSVSKDAPKLVEDVVPGTVSLRGARWRGSGVAERRTLGQRFTYNSRRRR